MEERIQGGGGDENPAVQGDQVEGEFEGAHLAPGTPPDEMRAQADSRGSGSFVPDAGLLAESHAVETTGPARAPLGSVQGTSSSSEVAIPEPPAQRQAPLRPKITISNPGSEIHRRHMESSVATLASGYDPSRYISPRSYRSCLNTELFANGSPFLLSDAFYEGSRGGTEWRQVAGEIPTTPEDTTTLQALCREVDTLWPDRNKGGLSFSEFISGIYAGFDQSRYDLSGEERQLLINIVIQVKSLKKELRELRKELADIEAKGQIPSQELKDRIGLLQNGLTSVETTVRDHDQSCHLRLQEIVRTGAQQVDRMVSNSDDVNSPEVVTKQILAQYRLQLVDKVMDFKTGSFFKEDHQMIREKSSFTLNFETVLQGICRGPAKMYLYGTFEEKKQAARLVVSDAWGLNEPKVATNETHEIPEFQFKDFVDPFVRMLTGGEGLQPLATSAKETFARLNEETRGAFARSFLESEVTFEDFCTIYGKGADEMREDFLDYGMMSEFSDREHIADLIDARGDKPEPAIVAKLFLAHLYHTGALVRPSPGDIEMEEASTPHQIFPEALVKKTEDRRGNGELAFAIFPNEFVLRPSHADELYFEAQKPSSETCGIHALNHFIGKPIFGSKETEGAHILYKCFTEASDLVSKLTDIRKALTLVQSQLNDVKKTLKEWEIPPLRALKISSTNS
ncbi:MAG: hypothetical protein LBE98_00660 [Puniceicoccales bacterium]|jgi:hypothetical protein|nr:hypothetical protein [Puniceicoccales bacterium]